MPYQPTNPYPYNTGIDVNDGLTFKFKIDNYDTINKFKLELYDVYKNEKIYTIIRTVGDIANRTGDDVENGIIDISSGEIIDGDEQLIQILDNNNEQLLLDIYEVKDKNGILSSNNQLPVYGGRGELSICELQLDKYMVKIDTIEKKKYYGNIKNNQDLVIAKEEWFELYDDMNIIKSFNPGNDEVPNQLVIPYRIKGRIVEGIGDNVFKNQLNENEETIVEYKMQNIKTVIIPSSVFSIGCNCFENATVDEVLFNYGNSEIKMAAFKNSTIKKVLLLDSISIIQDSAFENCKFLSEVIFSHTLREIPNYCFKGCSRLKHISFLSNIINIKEEAFFGCDNLIEIKCISGLKSIGTRAFANCSNVVTVEIPESVQIINKEIFKGNDKIIEMILPFIGRDRNNNSNYSEYILSYFFEQNTERAETSQQISSTIIIKGYIPQSLHGIKITDAVNIGNGAFCNCNMLYYVEMNEEIEHIGNYAFYNCNNIENFIVGKHIISIGAYAFGMDKIIN